MKIGEQPTIFRSGDEILWKWQTYSLLEYGADWLLKSLFFLSLLSRFGKNKFILYYRKLLASEEMRDALDWDYEENNALITVLILSQWDPINPCKITLYTKFSQYFLYRLFDRVVKVMDLKSIVKFTRRFEPCSSRFVRDIKKFCLWPCFIKVNTLNCYLQNERSMIAFMLKFSI